MVFITLPQDNANSFLTDNVLKIQTQLVFKRIYQ